MNPLGAHADEPQTSPLHSATSMKSSAPISTMLKARAQQKENDMDITIRNELAADIDTITLLTETAFHNEAHSSHTEQFIVNALRHCGQLTISMVAVEGNAILGHVAISPVAISSGATGWYGLGPISVWPDRQGKGIGSQLMKTALAELQRLGAIGCVVLGNPTYYGRFGFKAHPNLMLDSVPPDYFQALSFKGQPPAGNVSYHAAFNATE